MAARRFLSDTLRATGKIQLWAVFAFISGGAAIGVFYHSLTLRELGYIHGSTAGMWLTFVLGCLLLLVARRGIAKQDGA